MITAQEARGYTNKAIADREAGWDQRADAIIEQLGNRIAEAARTGYAEYTFGAETKFNIDALSRREYVRGKLEALGYTMQGDTIRW